MKTIDKLSFVPLLALLLFAGSCEKDGGVFLSLIHISEPTRPY